MRRNKNLTHFACLPARAPQNAPVLSRCASVLSQNATGVRFAAPLRGIRIDQRAGNAPAIRREHAGYEVMSMPCERIFRRSVLRWMASIRAAAVRL